MAVVAKFVFPDRNAAQNARSKIADELGSGAAFCFGDEVEITDECRDFPKAIKICEAYGGRPK